MVLEARASKIEGMGLKWQGFSCCAPTWQKCKQALVRQKKPNSSFYKEPALKTTNPLLEQQHKFIHEDGALKA
jgi:hypothetical protein